MQLLGILLLVPVVAMNTIPSKFFGRFVHDHSEHFDEFLASKGVNWFIRKMIQFTSVTKVISEGEKPGTYNLENLSSKKNTKYDGWKLGEQFQGEGMDGTVHNITFDFKDDTLTETHYRIQTADLSGETYFYNIDKDDFLVMKMENNNITCRRFFKREQKSQ